MLAVFPLTSYRLALRLHNEVPGIVVPEALQDELREAGPREPEVGFAHARELLAAARDRAAGVYVVAPYRQPLSVLELLAGARCPATARRRRSTPARASSTFRTTPRGSRSRRCRRPSWRNRHWTRPSVSIAGPPELPWRTPRRGS